MGLAPTRQDIAAAALLAALAFGVFSYRAAAPPLTEDEKPLSAAVDLLHANGGRDDAGRFLPLFVRVSSEVWLPPVPVYASVVMATMRRDGQPGRRAAAVFGALGVALTYWFAVALFRRPALGWIASLVLLCCPAYVIGARSGALDGVWVIPLLVVFLVAVAKFAETQSRPSLAIAVFAVVACVYTQPSGAFHAAILGVAAIIGLRRAGLFTTRDAVWSATVAVAAALPLALWFAVHPETYINTLGSWFLHPAHIRPWALAARLSSWVSLAEWASIYWNVFDPTHLLYNVEGPASTGTFLLASGVFLAVAARDLAWPQQPRSAHESALLWIAAIGFVAAPIVPAAFNEPGGIQRALSLALFGAILVTFGVRALLIKPSMWTRVAVVLLLGLAFLQFVAFYRAILNLPL
jgi:hypothetical protein